jgi:hypothetical protein
MVGPRIIIILVCTGVLDVMHQPLNHPIADEEHADGLDPIEDFKALSDRGLG